jgi:hypothetical protein
MSSVEKNNVKNLDFIGLPPDADNEYGRAQRFDFLPKVEITPALPNLKAGLHGFTLRDAKTQFSNDFNDIARRALTYIRTASTPLQVYYLAESFPSETFQSEYGESFLEKFADVASGGLSEIAFMMGAPDISTATKAIEAAAGATGSDILGAIGAGIGTARKKTTETIDRLIRAGGAAATLGRSLQFASKMVMGGRVDLPQVWKNSSYGISYAITVRLYNPNPGSLFATETYILAPLIALLLLVLPRSKRLGGKIGEATKGIFHFPYLCKLNSPGIFNLPSGYVSSINIIKGGDQGLYAHNQHLGMCDVRIEFGNLYGTMVQGLGNDRDVPTLTNYIMGLQDLKVLKGEKTTISTLTPGRRTFTTKQEQTPAEMTDPAPDRTSSSARQKSNGITVRELFQEIKDKLIG